MRSLSLKPRHDGLSERRQRRFVTLLRELGVVEVAAKAVDCSAQSAYKLRKCPGADHFAKEWDLALTEARDRAFDLTVDRAINGFTQLRFYRHTFAGTWHRYDNRLAMAAINAADRAPRIDRTSSKGET